MSLPQKGHFNTLPKFPPVIICHITLLWLSALFLVDVFIYLVTVYQHKDMSPIMAEALSLSFTAVFQTALDLWLVFNRNKFVE